MLRTLLIIPVGDQGGTDHIHPHREESPWHVVLGLFSLEDSSQRVTQPTTTIGNGPVQSGKSGVRLLGLPDLGYLDRGSVGVLSFGSGIGPLLGTSLTSESVLVQPRQAFLAECSLFRAVVEVQCAGPLLGGTRDDQEVVGLLEVEHCWNL